LLSSFAQAVEELEAHIRLHHGQNAADLAFRRRVEELISSLYDDIDVVVQVPLRSLFHLLVIKALYVDRASTDAEVITYLGDMLTRYLYTRELFPFLGPGGRRQLFYFSHLLEEMQQGFRRFQNLFEACRRYGDNALFLTGVFPQSFRRPRLGRLGLSRPLDASYYITTGKACYRLAADHELAHLTQLRPVLLKLSRHFELYMAALNDISQRYIMGLDMNLIADKMLDAFNQWRHTGDARYLEKARRYAALLKVDPSRFPSLFRGHNLGRLN
jgi:hypothetical protein